MLCGDYFIRHDISGSRKIKQPVFHGKQDVLSFFCLFFFFVVQVVVSNILYKYLSPLPGGDAPI